MCKYNLPLFNVGELKSDDSDDDEENGDEADDVVRVSKKEDAAHNGACSANACPNGVSGSNGDAFHRLRNGKEAQDDEDDSDDTGGNPGKSLAEFQSDRKTDLKKTGEK